jgi:hypothetical protein
LSTWRAWHLELALVSLEPLYYSSLDALVGALDEKIINPAKARFAELLARKAQKMKGEHVWRGHPRPGPPFPLGGQSTDKTHISYERTQSTTVEELT